MLVVFVAGLAPAASAAATDQLAGLFIQSCLPYAGHPEGLRTWAKDRQLPEVPEPARAAFLHGAPGQVFDASNAEGKFVVISSDDGICAVLTNQVQGPAAAQSLEDGLRRSGIAFRLAIEREDKQVAALHHREYLATRNGRGWRILVATVNDQAGGQAMLTAAPE